MMIDFPVDTVIALVEPLHREDCPTYASVEEMLRAIGTEL